MSERYSKLFSLPENLYAEGAPVIVSAGNLLKDNQTGKVLAQLKIKNIAAKPLKAATVLIHPQDAAGKPMADDTQQKYLDLTAKTGEEFGQKIAVFLPDVSARGFSVEVTQAVFSDNSTWEGTAAQWEPLPAPASLSEKLGDAELVKQYQLQFGGKCEVAPTEHKDLWLCACGAWNKNEKCYCCGKGKAAQLALDLDALKSEKDARLAREKAEREAKEAAEKAAAEASAKKMKKLLSILIPAVVVCVVALLLITKVIIPNSNYNKAVALMDNGRYEEAIDILRELVGYKDSGQLILRADSEIQEAKRKSEEEERNAAEAVRNEEDYNNAIFLISDDSIENDDEAYVLFTRLGEYKDAKNYAARFQKVLLSSRTPWWSIEYHYVDGKIDSALEKLSDTFWFEYKYSYDTNGRLVKVVQTSTVSDQIGTAIFTYDGDRLDTKTVTWENLTRPYSCYIKYDTNGLPIHTRLVEERANGDDYVHEWFYTYTLDNEGFIIKMEVQQSVNNAPVGFASRTELLEGQRFIVESDEWNGRVSFTRPDIYLLGDAGNGVIYRYELGVQFALNQTLKYQCSYNPDGTIDSMVVTGGTRDYTRYFTYGYIYIPDS